MNIHTGEVRPLAELTKAERESGDWIPIPDPDAVAREAEAAKRQLQEQDAVRARHELERAQRAGKTRKFNGRHRLARMFAFAGEQSRKAKTEKNRRRQRRQSQRRNRS